jgi:hypothetical protein
VFSGSEAENDDSAQHTISGKLMVTRFALQGDFFFSQEMRERESCLCLSKSNFIADKRTRNESYSMRIAELIANEQTG